MSGLMAYKALSLGSDYTLALLTRPHAITMGIDSSCFIFASIFLRNDLGCPLIFTKFGIFVTTSAVLKKVTTKKETFKNMLEICKICAGYSQFVLTATNQLQIIERD